MRITSLSSVGLLAFAVACGGGDAGPDARITGYDAPDRTQRAYLIKKFTLPTTLEEVNDGKFEFPGSGIPVNKMGALIQVQMDLLEGLPVQADMDAAFLAGEARHTLWVTSGPLDKVDGGAWGAVTRVVDVDDPADPSNDYEAGAQFRLAPGASMETTWQGIMNAGEIDGANPDAMVSYWDLPLVSGGELVSVPGVHPVLRGTVTEDTYVGWGGSGITREQVEQIVLPPTAALLTRAIAMDLPKKNDIKGLFDTNDDDVVTPQELVNSPTMATLLQPDMDLDGDGVGDHISQSIRFEAVRVEIVP